MRNPVRSVTSGISGAIVLIGLALAFAFGGFNLSIFFVALAFASLIGSFGSLNPRNAYGGIQGFVWLLGLALCFAIGFWPWILVVAAVSALMGALIRPIVAALVGIGIFGLASSMANRQRPQQQYYQPPPQQPYEPYQQGYQPPPQQPYEPYQQGYQPPPVYQEGGQQYPYPQQYEQPQAQYPQEMPPQQQ